MMEDQQIPEIQEDLGTGGKFKNWLQDNIRIIISVLIVIAIAGGIYSYSKRGEVSTTEEEIAMEELIQKDDAVTVVGEKEDEISDEDVIEEKMEADEEALSGEDNQKEEPVSEDVKVSQSDEDSAQQTISEETGEAFVETAVRGDSQTTLARKALRNYLEKNEDSSLTAEHKIYIEDYLRKNVQYGGGVDVGDSISFSKVMIKDAIEKSKTLDENQLENLKKYSARVSNL